MLASDQDWALRNYEYDGLVLIPSLLSLLCHKASLWTPLQYASMWDSTGEAARLLLRYGCNPNNASFVQMTPLHLAVYYDHIRVVQVLLDRRASIRVHDKYGKLPMAYARSKRMRQLLQQAQHISTIPSDDFQLINLVRSPSASVTEDDRRFHDLTAEVKKRRRRREKRRKRRRRRRRQKLRNRK